MLRNQNHRRSAFTIFVILILSLAIGCQNHTPEAMTLRVHIIDGLSESKTVMPDGFRGVDRYELTVVDNGGTEVAKAMTNSSVDAVVDGIAPGSYTFAVKGYTTIGGVEHLIVDDNENVTVKDGMSEVSVAVSDVAAGTGAVDVTITATIPDGYTFADDVVAVRLYEGVDGGVAAYETTVGYSVNGDTMTAEWVSDSVETGIYTMEVQADGLFGKTVMYVLPGMTAKGSVEVNPMVAEKVSTPVISNNQELQIECIITCATPGSIIRYTLDGTDPTALSAVYSNPFRPEHGTIIKACAFKDGMKFSDVAEYEFVLIPTDVPLGSVLSDGSIICYDRGESYGEYNLSGGILTRITEGIDDGTKDSENWRFLIVEENDFVTPIEEYYFANSVSPSIGVMYNISSTNYIGSGLPNSVSYLSKLGGDETYIWNYINSKRNTDKYDWFVPSLAEYEAVWNNGFLIDSEKTYLTSVITMPIGFNFFITNRSGRVFNTMDGSATSVSFVVTSSMEENPDGGITIKYETIKMDYPIRLMRRI